MSEIFEKHLQSLESTTERKQAVIREAECIGCTKCIPACPVDAIIGGAKQMHAILTMDCTGCELCVEPCPVDCIDMIAVPEVTADLAKKQLTHFKTRYEKHQRRTREKSKVNRTNDLHFLAIDKKSYLNAALLRVKNKVKK